MRTPDETFVLLDEALAHKKAAGCDIICGDFGDGVHRCCALTALTGELIDEWGAPFAASKKLDIPSRAAWAIAWGFDGLSRSCNGESKHYPDFHEVGARLRAKYITNQP